MLARSLLLAIVGCGQPSARDPACTDTFYADLDGDGHGDALATVTDCSAPSGYTTTSDDCDDDSATIHPGADETCNALDDDCDLAVDEDAIDAHVWYTDADADGFGDDGAVTTACTAAGDQVAVAGDCADGDAAVNPDADELCNDVDDDCDALVDSEDPSLAQGTFWYTDADGDGYGDPATGALVCEEPAGRTTDSSDCDDTDGAVHPNAHDTCDGTDDDCDGRACVTIDLSMADAKLVGENADDHAGYSVSGAGDVDGDGHADLLLGAYQNEVGRTDAGAAYLVRGPVTGTLDLSLADAKLVGDGKSGWWAGYSVAGAGDVDGDGLDDLLVGALLDREGGGYGVGAAYLVQGPVTGAVNLSGADAKLVGEQAYDYAGYCVSDAGDVDSDGHDDLLVGAPGYDSGGTVSVGAAYLVLGPVTGTVDLSLADAKFVGDTSWCCGEAGLAVSGAGDMDGDGRDDFLVSEPGLEYLGAIFLVLGPVTGTLDSSDADAQLWGEGDPYAAGAGWSLSGAGDVDGDGHLDLLVGAPNDDEGAAWAGAAYLVLGPVTGTKYLASADAKFLGEHNSDQAGTVSGAGDVNSDGHDDVLVGAIYGGTNGTGAAYLVLGPVTGTFELSDADVLLGGEAAYDEAGNSVSGAGDVDADGQDDLLVGAHRNDEGGEEAGAAYLVYGGSLF